MHHDWVKTIKNCCAEYNKPFFFKQWSGVNKKKAGRLLDNQLWNGMPCHIQAPLPA